MASIHSILVETQPSDGNLFQLPIRQSIHCGISEEASRQLYTDWAATVAPVDQTRLLLDARGHFVTFACPSTLPERLAIITKFMDVGFLHDDVIDELDSSEAQASNEELVAAIGSQRDEQIRQRGTDSKAAKDQMLGQMLKEIMVIDPVGAAELMTEYKNLLLNVYGKKTVADFETFDEWLEYRYVDCSSTLLHTICCFGANIMVTEAQKRAVQHIVRPILSTYCLTNDLYSWEKEHAESVARGQPHSTLNSVQVLINQYAVGVPQAKDMLRAKIRLAQAEYLSARREFELDNGQLVGEWQAYVDLAQLFGTGASYWTSFAQRYRGIPEKSTEKDACTPLRGAGGLLTPPGSRESSP